MVVFARWSNVYAYDDEGRSVTMTETRKVWGYQMVACGKQRNESVELAGGRRKPVQQHDRWRVLRASFAVEDADAVNVKWRDRSSWQK